MVVFLLTEPEAAGSVQSQWFGFAAQAGLQLAHAVELLPASCPGSPLLPGFAPVRTKAWEDSFFFFLPNLNLKILLVSSQGVPYIISGADVLAPGFRWFAACGEKKS